jgi:uncharacterized protein (DUF1800 family)
MRRFLLTLAVVPLLRSADARFDKKLTKDQQILHSLNRLTFGPRPGDVEQVRKLGVEKWIELQLHPDQVPENPVLESRLKPMETLRMDPADILKDYSPNQAGFRPFTPLNELLSQDQVRRVMSGTHDERMSVIDPLDADKRKKVLSSLAPNALSCEPDLQKEAEAARKERQEEQQKDFRRRNPPLNDLLNQDQISAALRGSPEQLRDLFSYLDPAKRKQVAGALPPQSLAAFPDLRREGMRARQPQQVLLGDLREGKVFRAVYSNRQLEEVLVDFWFNHFNVYEGKQQVRALLASYEREAIRPHVLGRFKDLLLATARHPAMLYYLDNYDSISPNAFEIGPFAGPANNMAQQLSRQAHGLNENYGRELMELHTLGVDGGYTQKDVVEVARCFTGWTVRQPNTKPAFVFAGFMHDANEKEVLGHKIAAGGGENDGLRVIDILAHHPATARFISKKLAQRFVSDDPPQALIDRMTQTFTKTDGDLRAVMQTMFVSPEFFSEGAWESKMKSPLEMVVSAVRALDGAVTDTYTLAQKIGDLGEPLYGRVEPRGYPNTGEAWLNTASVLGRINFGTALLSGQIAGVKLDTTRLEGKDAGTIAREVLARDPLPGTEEAIRAGVEGKEPTPRFLAGLVIGSPEFQRR